MSDDKTTNVSDVSDLLEMGAEMADVGDRITAIGHPEDDGVAVLVSRECTDEGGDQIVLARDVMEALDQRMPGPRARKGTHTITELESLVAYVNRYKSDNTLAWANVDAFKLEVVLDDHPEGHPLEGKGKAAWRQHRAVYTCPRSPEWKAWTEHDGRPLGQEQFADFVETRLEDLRGGDGYPKPLEVLNMARHLVMHQKGMFERKIDPTTGNGILINKVENVADSTVIPRAFLLGIPVFEGGAAYQVEARVRFALTEGRPVFSYTLHRRKEIERDAFNDVRSRFHSATAVLVLAGTP